LLARGVIQGLADQRLVIETRVAEWTTPEFPLVLEHRALPIVSFPSEWSAAQLKAAALLVLDLEAALRRHDLTLIDANPWNVLFDATHPIFVDFCCIAPVDEHMWHGRREVVEFYLNPLLLFEGGLSRAARRMLFDPWVGVTDADLARLSGRTPPRERILARAFAAAKRAVKRVAPQSMHASLKSAAAAAIQRDPLKDIAALRQRISALPIAQMETDWQGYYRENFPDFVPSEKWTAKHHAIHKVLAECKPGTAGTRNWRPATARR
jgi:hypothetical protein